MRAIPPRTMRDIWKEKGENRPENVTATLPGNLAELVHAVTIANKQIEKRLAQSIKSGHTQHAPAYTTPDRSRSARNAGFTTGGIGGAGNTDRTTTYEQQWDVSKHAYNKGQTRAQPRKSRAPAKQRIQYTAETMADYNGGGDLGVILQFTGLDLAGNFKKSRNNYEAEYGQPACVYWATCIHHNGSSAPRPHNAAVILSTIGDILEMEVVPQQRGKDQLFSDTIHIPELKGYDPLSMTVEGNEKIITLGYKKINGSKTGTK